MNRSCPICNANLQSAQANEARDDSARDYYCSRADHHYSERIVGGDPTIMKVRVNSGAHRMYFKIYVEEGYTEIWEGIDSKDRVKVECVFKPDYSNLNTLVDKLRTYLVFS